MLSSNPSSNEEKGNSDHLKISVSFESLICSVTLKIMFDPISTPCGHTFDVTGLPPSVKNCPLCRKTLKGIDRNARNIFTVSLFDQFYNALPHFPDGIKEKIKENLELTDEMIEQVARANSETLLNRLINLIRFKPDYLNTVILQLSHKNQWDLIAKIIKSVPMTNEVLNVIEQEGHYKGWTIAHCLALSEYDGLPLLMNFLKQNIYMNQDSLNLMTKSCSTAYCLALEDEGISYLDELMERKVHITQDTLNAIKTTGEGIGSSVGFQLTSSLRGISHLSKLLNLGVALNFITLNTRVHEENEPGYTAAHNLSASAEGIDYLLKLMNLKVYMETVTLNTPITETHESYPNVTPALLLAKRNSGIKLLHQLMDVGIHINSDNLNAIQSSGELRGDCIADILSTCPEGMALLFRLMKLNILIKPELLTVKIIEGSNEGLSFGYSLSKTPRGIELLGELAKINSKYSFVILKDAALVTELMKTNEGQQLVEACKQLMEKSVAKTGLFKPKEPLAESKAEPMNTQENLPPTGNSSEAHDHSVCGKRAREKEAKEAQVSPSKRQCLGLQKGN